MYILVGHELSLASYVQLLTSKQKSCQVFLRKFTQADHLKEGRFLTSQAIQDKLDRPGESESNPSLWKETAVRLKSRYSEAEYASLAAVRVKRHSKQDASNPQLIIAQAFSPP